MNHQWEKSINRSINLTNHRIKTDMVPTTTIVESCRSSHRFAISTSCSIINVENQSIHQFEVVVVVVVDFLTFFRKKKNKNKNPSQFR